MVEHIVVCVSTVLTVVDSQRFNEKKLKFNNSIKIGQLYLSPGECIFSQLLSHFSVYNYIMSNLVSVTNRQTIKMQKEIKTFLIYTENNCECKPTWTKQYYNLVVFVGFQIGRNTAREIRFLTRVSPIILIRHLLSIDLRNARILWTVSLVEQM